MEKQLKNHLYTQHIVAGTAAVILLGTLIADVYYALNNSWFIGQDFDHLLLAQDKSFLAFLLTPIDIHFPLPLHRFFTWLVFIPLKMSFFDATLILAFFVSTSTLYFYYLLQLIQPSKINPILAVLYLCNPYVLDLFLWWSSGLHRLPYLLCTLACLYHGLSFVKHGIKKDACISFFFFIAAFGFFEKALLIPIHFATLVLLNAFFDKHPLGNSAKILIAAMLITDVLYVGKGLFFSQSHDHFTNSRTAFFLTLWLGLKKTTEVLLPAPLPPTTQPYALFIITPYLAYICRRKPIIFAIISLFLLLLALNFLPAAASNRAEMFGPGYITLARYHFENIFIILLAFKYIHISMKKSDSTDTISEKSTFKTTAIAILLLTYGVLSHQTSTLMAKEEYSVFGGKKAAQYIRNLRNSLNLLGNDFVLIKDQQLASFLFQSAPPFMRFIPLSRIASEWIRLGKFTFDDSAEYFVDEKGNVRRKSEKMANTKPAT